MRRIGNVNDKKGTSINVVPSNPEYLWQLPEEEKPKKRVALVIPDTHFPYNLKDALDFLIEVSIEKEVTDIFHIGDLVDSATINMHTFDPDGLSPSDEIKKTREQVKKWAMVFPYMTVLRGNHETAALRRAKNKGQIPTELIRTIPEIYKFPDTWEFVDKAEFKNVVLEHGTRFGGASGAINTAQNNMKSSVIGHSHQEMGVQYKNNGERQIYGMYVGTLIDDSSIAFTYAAHAKHRSALGCGIIYDDQHAEVIPYRKKGE